MLSYLHQHYLAVFHTFLSRVRVYRQHIREPQHQQLKAEGHLRLCGNGEFGIVPLLQMRS